jgi:hypothetical protein
MVTTGARLMPKFTLIAEHTDFMQKPDGTKVSYDFHCDFLPEVLEHFELFLRGCGYNPTGKLDFIPDEQYYGEPPEEDWIGDGHDGMGSTMADYPELYDEQDLPQGKSHYYFDTQRNK